MNMKYKIFFFGILTFLLLSATHGYGVLINWGAGEQSIMEVDGSPVEDGSLVQLIWDRNQDGINPPGLDGLPSDGDELIAISFIGKGSFIPGTFSENTFTGTVSIGDVMYVRAWNGPSPSTSTHFGDTRYHNPNLWIIDSDLDFTLDATKNRSWKTQLGWTGLSESEYLTQTFAFSLSQSYPNPFNQKMSVTFTVPGTLTYTSETENGKVETIAEKSPVKLKIYDVTGRLVKTLIDGSRAPGQYRVEWEGKDKKGELVSSGIYFYSLHAGEEKAIGKLILLR
jgi:hypothetical protein